MTMEGNTNTNAIQIQKEILLRFRKITHRQANLLAHIIEIVSNGLKLGYIWDLSYIVTHHQITELLVSLKEQNLLRNDLIAFKLFDDIGFCNRSELFKNCERNTYIDISSKNERPTVLSKHHEHILTQMISEIRSQFRDTEHFVEIILDDSKYCIPTAFGYLAGYPIIYWYENVPTGGAAGVGGGGDGKNCLNNIENFLIYKVYNKELLLFQFSCPKNLIENVEVKRTLADWLNGFCGPLRVETVTKINSNAITL